MRHAIRNTAATGFLIGLLGSCHLRVEAVLFLSIGRRTARWCVVSSVGARLDPAKWCGIEFCVRVASLSRMSLLPMSQRPKAAPHALRQLLHHATLAVATAGPSFISAPERCRHALPLFGSTRRPGPTSLVSRGIACIIPDLRVGPQWSLPFRRQSCCRLPSPGKLARSTK